MKKKNKIKELTLVEKGIVLSFKKRAPKELLYSDLANIYISSTRTKPLYEFLLILLAMIVAATFFFLLGSNIVLTTACLLFFSITVKMSTFKRYSLHICLNDGQVFEKKVQAKLKHNTIDLVNEVKKQIFNYKLQNSNEPLLKKIAV